MSENKISIDDIKELSVLLKENNLSEISVTSREFTVNIKSNDIKSSGEKNIVLGDINHLQDQVINIKSETTPSKAKIVEKNDDNNDNGGNEMLSPIVGTYYSSPAPDKPAFVTVGSKVKKGDILFIIESMKLMNEIPSEFDGEIVKIIVSDGDAVEFHQPIMVIK